MASGRDEAAGSQRITVLSVGGVRVTVSGYFLDQCYGSHWPVGAAGLRKSAV